MANDSGFGQQDPSDGVGELNPLLFVIWQQLAKVSTIKVVLVKAVDTAKKTVDVQPMVNQLDGDNQSTPHGTVLGIPYIIWQYGKNAVLADPAIDDIGVMMCSDRDISSVKATKAISNPGSDNRFAAADGIYLGGILNGAAEQWLRFTDTGMDWHDKNANTILSNADGIYLNGILFNRSSQVQGNLPVTGALELGGSLQNISGGLYAGDIHVAGTVTGDTDVVSGALHLRTHRHTGVTTGGGTSTGPVP